MVLPVDPADAVARTLAFIRGDDTYERSAAIEGLHARLAHLHDADSDEAMRETAAHLPVLEALFLKFGADAVAADSVDHQSKLMKLSMAAHSEYVRTVGLLAGLKHQRKGPGPGVDAVVVVE